MKDLPTIFALFFIGITLHGQTLQWAKQIGGTDVERLNDMSLDENSNIYSTGYFRETVDFDPGNNVLNLTSTGTSYDIYINKLDVQGNHVWTKQIGCSTYGWGTGITVSENDHVLVTGQFHGTADFDPNISTDDITSNGGGDIFISKLDDSGNMIWVKRIGGSGFDVASRIEVDSNDNVYVVGAFSGTVDFDPSNNTFNLTSTGDRDIFICKLNASGDFVWAKSLSGNEIDYPNEIALDNNGSMYITGYFSGTVDFDPGNSTFNLTSTGDRDIFICKLNTLGDFVWAKSLEGIGDAERSRIALDNNGNTYITGWFYDTVDFDPGNDTFNLASIGGSRDIFICKLNASGDFVWAKSIGGSDSDEGLGIVLDQGGSIYTTGQFSGTADFDPGNGVFNLVNTGGHDVFISKLDSNGNFLWALPFEGTGGFNEGIDIKLDVLGNIYTGGIFMATTDFDPGSGTLNLTSNGNYDIFMHKIEHCVNTTGIDTQVACNSYTWIDGNTYTSNNNTATYVLPNATGCDSTVTLHLTVNPNNMGDTAVTACDSFNWYGTTYTAAGDYQHVLLNQAGCDSTVTLNLTFDSVDTIVTYNGSELIANATGATYQWINCDNGNVPISGETNQTYMATTNGNYAVVVTENGCTATSSCFHVTNVGVSVLKGSDKGINIYPNPAKDKAYIQLDQAITEGVTYRIYNSLGKKLSEQKITDLHTEIDMSRFHSGIYFVVVLEQRFKMVKD